jgi:hypothetical protein
VQGYRGRYAKRMGQGAWENSPMEERKDWIAEGRRKIGDCRSLGHSSNPSALNNLQLSMNKM